MGATDPLSRAEHAPTSPAPQDLARALRPSPRWWWLPAAGLALVTAALAATALRGPLLHLDGALQSWASVTIAITLQALPFLVGGTLVSGLVGAYLPETLLARLTPRRQVLAVPAAACAGVLLPGCECASVPVAQSLIRRGVPAPAAYAFLLASPAVNPVVLAATWTAFPANPLMAPARLLASLLAATTVGWVWALASRQPPVQREVAHTHAGASRAQVFRACVVHDLTSAAGYLAAGAMLTALLKVAVPASWMTAAGQVPAAQVLVMAALAVILSLCSEADAFVAASLVATSPLSQLVFLTVGPMVDLKLMAMQHGAWGGRFVARFVPLSLAASIGASLLVGTLLLGGA